MLARLAGAYCFKQLVENVLEDSTGHKEQMNIDYILLTSLSNVPVTRNAESCRLHSAPPRVCTSATLMGKGRLVSSVYRGDLNDTCESVRAKLIRLGGGVVESDGIICETPSHSVLMNKLVEEKKVK